MEKKCKETQTKERDNATNDAGEVLTWWNENNKQKTKQQQQKNIFWRSSVFLAFSSVSSCAINVLYFYEIIM